MNKVISIDSHSSGSVISLNMNHMKVKFASLDFYFTIFMHKSNRYRNITYSTLLYFSHWIIPTIIKLLNFEFWNFQLEWKVVSKLYAIHRNTGKNWCRTTWMMKPWVINGYVSSFRQMYSFERFLFYPSVVIVILLEKRIRKWCEKINGANACWTQYIPKLQTNRVLILSNVHNP